VDLADPLIVSVSRRIAAPAHEIFLVVARPMLHPEIDGSGMVRATNAPPIVSAGDAFVVRMHNDEFGDYEMRNEVVEFIEDRLIAWAPKRHDLVDDVDWNHRWGWQLTPEGALTQVEGFFDCTRVPEDGQRILRGGEWARPILERSLERLEALVTSP